MGFSITWVLLTIAGFLLRDSSTHAVPSEDPCTHFVTLPNLPNRIEGYNMSTDQIAVCDRYLIKAWYALDKFTLSKNPNVSCGTHVGWYMTGDLPDGEVPVYVRVCSTYDVNCTSPTFVQVQQCFDKYVFELAPLRSCNEAYCVEPMEFDNTSAPPDISMYNATVHVELVNVTKDNATYAEMLRIYCDLNLQPDLTNIFKVEWSVSVGPSFGRHIYTSPDTYYLNLEQFRSITAVREEEHLIAYKAGISVLCAVSARTDTTGRYSTPVISNSKFLGIEVITERGSVLVNDEEKEITLRLTVPFRCPENNVHCGLTVNMIVPNEIDSETCQIPSIVHTGDQRSPCGVVFKKGDFNKNKTFTLTAQDGTIENLFHNRYTVLLKTLPFSSHPFFSNYFLEPLHLDLISMKGKVSNTPCYAHSDPHMRTFDGRTYENRYKHGIYHFILYKHTVYMQEVQMKTTNCWPNSDVTCICAVAVRAGKDVFVIDICSGETNIKAHLCESKVLKDRIKQKGNTYTVTLPTGTIVKLRVGTLISKRIEADIFPSLRDYNRVEGLCGHFDGNKSNDWKKRPNKTGDFQESWRVRDKEEDLFNKIYYDDLEGWDETTILCDCTVDENILNFGDLKPSATCKPDCTKQCTNTGQKNFNGDICDGRKRRGVSLQTQYDVHFGHETDMGVDVEELSAKWLHSQRTKRTTYDNNTARADCVQIMNTTTFQKCSQFAGMDVETAIQDCVADAIASGTMHWTLEHLEGVKQQCLHYVKVNQPIPAEILEKLTAVPNISLIMDMYNLSTTIVTPTANQPEITPELLQTLEDDDCPLDCSGHGTCVKGNCVCDSEYWGVDCSLEKLSPVLMYGIPDKGKCDLQMRRCEQTSVFVRHIVESDKLSCRLSPYTVKKENTKRTKDVSVVKASLENMFEVKCPLPNERFKKSDDSVLNDVIAQVYGISISNDGSIFSDDDTLIIYDSACVNCTKAGSDIDCSLAPGFCITNGKCYMLGQTYGCYTCYDGTQQGVTWIAGPECSQADPPQSEKSVNGLVIGIIVGVCVVMVVIFALCYRYFKNRANERSKSLMNSHGERQTKPKLDTSFFHL